MLYAWAICCAIDPMNLKNWEERISKPLDWLYDLGYLHTAYNKTRVTYIADVKNKSRRDSPNVPASDADDGEEQEASTDDGDSEEGEEDG